MNSLDAQLNSILIELNRCLLQYAYECWPYAAAKDEAATKLRSLAEIQQTDVGVLVDVLLERQWPIDFGTYPTDYTAMQYNSIESLGGFLVESQNMAVTHIREVAAEHSDDAFIKEVLAQVLVNETAVLDELKAIAG
jgi:hypothetical protein